MKHIFTPLAIISLILGSLLLTGCSTGMVVKEPICIKTPFLYKMDSKPTVTGSCTDYKQVCVDKSWWTGKCVAWESECIEMTIKCSVTIKNYEPKTGTFGLKASFDTQNGLIDKGILWREIYPSEQETFTWYYITNPEERNVGCSVTKESIPQKEECE